MGPDPSCVQNGCESQILAGESFWSYLNPAIYLDPNSPTYRHIIALHNHRICVKKNSSKRYTWQQGELLTATFGESALPRANLATHNTPDTFGTEDMARQRSKTESIFLCLCLFSTNGCQKIHCKHPKGVPGTCANCLMNVSSLVFENQRSSGT